MNHTNGIIYLLFRLFSYDFFDDFLIILDRVRYKYH